MELRTRWRAFRAAVMAAVTVCVVLTVARGDEPDDTLFLIANTQFTLCHEIGHALVAELGIPVLGREEDFADMLSAICLLHPRHASERDPRAAEKLLAVADSWRLEWELDKGAENPPYWDTHSLDIQRFYNIVCLVYGADPARYADLPDRLRLPWERAWSCEDYEYRHAVEAVRWLLETYGAREGENAEGGRTVVVAYEPPATPARERLLRTVRASGVLEAKAALLASTFVLPHDITFSVANCLGDAASFWREDLREVAICYALLERFVHLTPLRHCLDNDAAQGADDAQVQKCLAEKGAQP